MEETKSNLYIHLDDKHLDTIDACVFSGDMFRNKANRQAFREYLARWERGLKEFDAGDILEEKE